jgi:hypothetical protein
MFISISSLVELTVIGGGQLRDQEWELLGHIQKHYSTQSLGWAILLCQPLMIRLLVGTIKLEPYLTT